MKKVGLVESERADVRDSAGKKAQVFFFPKAQGIRSTYLLRSSLLDIEIFDFFFCKVYI